MRANSLQVIKLVILVPYDEFKNCFPLMFNAKLVLIFFNINNKYILKFLYLLFIMYYVYILNSL